MLSELQIALLILAGLFGTVLSIILGWTESQDPFEIKKCVASLIRGFMASLIYLLGSYAFATEITPWDYVVVAIFSAGFEVYLKRGQAIATR